ncbi:hypothetical protein AAHA92_21212 [Salvia divinorum]|uniref:Uncharacterized protein n=1 Tax=Salvia divinorum TaxID=28513 RepID=A0ABD1GJQ4_SALDI
MRPKLNISPLSGKRDYASRSSFAIALSRRSGWFSPAFSFRSFKGIVSGIILFCFVFDIQPVETMLSKSSVPQSISSWRGSFLNS